ncbi:50S ribosomal protein L25/general stress protein Ctc [Mobilicoccus pelagius]|uniref:Large ribosomal subunit protein bL25 n=1 Tax=Mobilicoccus pelagius NBRC 104925 TaxID=1089455 RepID=H5USF9_9MICO|nr:50S ribosomal protein L25/general stress protein Ctc [Mobilicoccus pelagius]GAB48667.1 50S ribosomal protein L25 [Mobilicoccus pelagius NBRC 104925]
MADQPQIPASLRTEFGKGAARRIRRDDKIPAVLYGSGTDPVHLTLPGHETMLATKVDNALLELDIEGSKQLALVKDVQRDPIKPIIEHVDLVVVKRGEKVTVEVAVTVTGEAAPETVVTTENNTLEIEAVATNIPEVLEVSVEGAEAGTQILAAQVEMPEGSTLASDPELLVVNVTQALSEQALEAELEAAEAEAGIEKDESDEESGGAAEGGSEGASEESSDSE